MVKIEMDRYKVQYKQENEVISCEGVFTLSGSEEYEPILELFKQAADSCNGMLTLDIRRVEFLNSSGINTFTKFVIHVRRQEKLNLVGKAQENILWQVRLLKNLKRLLPSFVIELD